MIGSLNTVQAILEAIPNPIFIRDRYNKVVLVNKPANELLGRSQPGPSGTANYLPVAAEEMTSFCDTDDRVLHTGQDEEVEARVMGAAGDVRDVTTHKRLVMLEGEPHVMAIVTDVTMYRACEVRNEYLAFHDPATGLPNHALLRERITQCLSTRENSCALLYISLDPLRDVNEAGSHLIGEEMILEFATRLTALARASDTVARLGAQRFAILMSDTTDDPRAERLCKSVFVAATRALETTGAEAFVGASIGLVLTVPEAVNRVEFQRRADVALYQAEHEGRGCFRVFTDGMDSQIKKRQRLQMDLRQALQNEELEVHYQPLVSIATGAVEGMEALARWQHPARGPISPAEFIPIAETSGLIIELGNWVLAKACADALNWAPSLRLSVNVSPLQFADARFLQMVDEVLARTGFDPARLELEVTEGVLTEEPTRALGVLNALRERGIRIALDDFGTGYSSLSYFSRFPFDKIKIDRSFVSGMVESPHARSIVQAVISLGRGLDLTVVAEGVETEEQLSMLKAQGCSQAQGFLLSRPRPVADFGTALYHPPFLLASERCSSLVGQMALAMPALAEEASVH